MSTQKIRKNKSMTPVQKKVYQVLRRMWVPRQKILSDANYQDDLGFDSMDMLCLANALEFKFNIRIADDDISDIKTVNQTISYIDQRM